MVNVTGIIRQIIKRSFDYASVGSLPRLPRTTTIRLHEILPKDQIPGTTSSNCFFICQDGCNIEGRVGDEDEGLIRMPILHKTVYCKMNE